MLTSALIINAAVLFAVLEADLGRSRKVSTLRILRPVLLSATIVPMFMQALATQGTGLALEIGGAVAGVLLGLAATRLMKVGRDARTGRVVTAAGAPYAALWIAVIAARSAFSYGSAHWFSNALGTWMGSHQVTTAAITDTLILMAVGMTLARTVGLALRAQELSHRTPRLAHTAA